MADAGKKLYGIDLTPRTDVVISKRTEDWVREVVEGALTARIFRYFEIVVGLIFSVVLGWLFHEVTDMRADYRHVTDLDKRLEQQLKLMELTAENARLRDALTRAEPPSRGGKGKN